jgi:hypothetical protein
MSAKKSKRHQNQNPWHPATGAVTTDQAARHHLEAEQAAAERRASYDLPGARLPPSVRDQRREAMRRRLEQRR